MEEILDKFFPGVSVRSEEARKATINSKFLTNIEKKLSIQSFNEKLSSCGEKLERIRLANQFFEWIPLQSDVITKYSKSSEVSTVLRDKANQLYSAKKYKEALQYYNYTIMYALPQHESLGLAFANRSAVLMAMNKAKESLNDIEMAIQNKYPKRLMKKLEDRRKHCEEMLLDIAKKAQEEDQIKCEADAGRRKKFCERILFCVKQPNPKMPAAENFVEVRVDPYKGRKLVVNKDIPAGTVLTVETPYVCILKDALKWDVNHCHGCLKRIYCGVPCPNCVFTLYCDESCRKKAETEFHRFECPCLRELKCSTPRYVLLALRIIFKLGPKMLLNIYETQPDYFIQSQSQDEKGESKLISPEQGKKESVENDKNYHKIYDSNSYLPIHQLVSHSDQLDPLDIYSNTLNSIILTKMLDTCTDFFHDIDSTIKPDFMNFVASILLHHLENIPFNSIALEELAGLEDMSLLDTRREDPKKLAESIRFIQYPQFAAGVYAVSSLLNHSCDPNVTRVVDVENGILSVIATRALKSEEEILTNYTQSFIKDDISSRRPYLEENYHFTCQCVACINNWPELSELILIPPSFCCAKCSSGFSYDEKMSKDFIPCILSSFSSPSNKNKKGEISSCGLCGQEYSNQELTLQLDKNLESFFQAYSLVVNNFPLDAVRNLVGPLKYFQNNIVPPFNKYYMAQGIYKQALELIIRFSK